MSPQATVGVDFDQLKDLFETDPPAAEQKVAQIIDEYIQSLEPGHQQRARAFQWRLEQELRKFKDPVARMNKMVELFWKGVHKFQHTLSNPDQLLNQRGESVAHFPSKLDKVDVTP